MKITLRTKNIRTKSIPHILKFKCKEKRLFFVSFPPHPTAATTYRVRCTYTKYITLPVLHNARVFTRSCFNIETRLYTAYLSNL